MISVHVDTVCLQMCLKTKRSSGNIVIFSSRDFLNITSAPVKLTALGKANYTLKYLKVYSKDKQYYKRYMMYKY